MTFSRRIKREKKAIYIKAPCTRHYFEFLSHAVRF